MKTALLDANVLIALLWPAHVHHEASHAWFEARQPRGRWATCPLTEMAFVRIISNPSFSSDALRPADALSLLERNIAHQGHELWPDDVSLVEALGPSSARLQGHRQVSDSYLLALSVRHRGVLATFDAGLRSLAVGDRAGSMELVPVSRL
jgi:uncharacterized protein